MFTGIIRGLGRIKELKELSEGRTFIVEPGFDVSGLKQGDSLAVNGTCLTVEENYGDSVQLTAIRQTLSVTSLGDLEQGSQVNLEPAACLGDPMGGHMVSGHVDGICKVVSREDVGTGSEIELELAAGFSHLIIQKGSITLDGVSLTLADVKESIIKICLIPETMERTTIGEWKVHRKVNFEVDLVGKYVQKMLQSGWEPEGANAQ
jgi:riboflavin synthase